MTIKMLILLLCLLNLPAHASDRFGLIFIYHTDCTASQAFSHSIKAVTDHYKMDVLPISQNHMRFEEWPQTIPDQGQSKHLNITRVPYLALFDAQNQSIQPITNTYMSAFHLEQHIATLLEQTP